MVAEGARAAAEKARAEERRQAGERLHRRFDVDMNEAVDVIVERLDEAQEAVASAVAALDAYEAARDTAYEEWQQLFAGVPDDPTRRAFMAGGRPGGLFGKTTFGHVSRVDPILAVLAAIGDRLKGRERGKLTAADDDALRRLTDPPRGAGYRQLRDLKKRKDETQ